MDKQKILEWVNKLIQNYQDAQEALIDEFSGNPKDEREENEKYCDELREDIKNLLELH